MLYRTAANVCLTQAIRNSNKTVGCRKSKQTKPGMGHTPAIQHLGGGKKSGVQGHPRL